MENIVIREHSEIKLIFFKSRVFIRGEKTPAILITFKFETFFSLTFWLDFFRQKKTLHPSGYMQLRVVEGEGRKQLN